MIPVLHRHDARTTAQFKSNGLGRLVDAISCKVEEEINGIYECTLEYPISGKRYNDIEEGMIIYALHDSEKKPQPFDIYKRSAPMNGIVTFYARHISYRLTQLILEPYEADTANNVFVYMPRHYINNVPANTFTLNTEIDSTTPFVLDRPASVRHVLGGMEKSVLDLYGGEFIWDMFEVSHVLKRGQKRYIVLRYGKNLTDIRYEVDISQVANVVVPYWMSSDGQQRVMLDDVYVRNPDADLEKAIVLDVSSEYDTYPEEEDMIADAQKALAKIMLPSQNLEINFAALWETDEYKKFAGLQNVLLGDEVKCVHADMGLDEWLRVKRVVYDSLMERYDTIQLARE